MIFYRRERIIAKLISFPFFILGMNSLLKRTWLLSVISAFLTYFNVCEINFYFSWICYIPLFIALLKTSQKQSFKTGLIFGFALGVFCFSWMIPGAERFTGHSIIYGIGAFLISTFFLALFYGLLVFCFSFLKRKIETKNSIIFNGILIASIFVIGEFILLKIAEGLPWFDIHSGSGLAANDYSIQPASVFGIHILSFSVVLVNYLFATLIFKNGWKQLYIPVAIIIIHLLSGFLILNFFESKSNPSTSFQVAILSENIPPEIKWDETNGNILAQRLLDLNRSAVALKPNMALWSESAVPWTYRKDDDLLKEILSITAPAQVTHVLGINTDLHDNIVFNSAYCILPNGEVPNRYDKQNLLAFIEKPLSGLLMPFGSSAGFSAVTDKQNNAPLNTPYGKAGMFICNEATIPGAAANMIKQGAQFLFLISNDGWFNNTFIVKLHYYYARLRAVESRKDLAINCNNGYSGLIKASGEIVEQERSEEPFVKLVSMHTNNIITTASAYPNLFVYGCLAAIIIITVLSIYKFNK